MRNLQGGAAAIAVGLGNRGPTGRLGTSAQVGWGEFTNYGSLFVISRSDKRPLLLDGTRRGFMERCGNEAFFFFSGYGNHRCARIVWARYSPQGFAGGGAKSI